MATCHLSAKSPRSARAFSIFSSPWKKQKGLKLDDYISQTVWQLGPEDKVPFIEPEQSATLEQLMMSRSGIYIPSGNTGQEKILPHRGSFYPGTHFFYNNWDFDALRDDLAIPLRFQDFDRSRQKKNYVTGSNHFEYAMYLSARAPGPVGPGQRRMGQDRLGRPLKPSSTAPGPPRTSTRSATGTGRPAGTGRWGYGVLWWAWDAPKHPGDVMTGPYQGVFSAVGAGGQNITVFPFEDIDCDPQGQYRSG